MAQAAAIGTGIGEEKQGDPPNPKWPPSKPPLTMSQALRGLPKEMSAFKSDLASKLSTKIKPSEERAKQYSQRLENIKDTAKIVQEEYSDITQKGKQTVKNVINSINAALPYKLIFLIAFFAIFYNVIFNICIFFGIDIILLNMYMGWVSFLLILFTFLPTEYSNIFTPNKE